MLHDRQGSAGAREPGSGSPLLPSPPAPPHTLVLGLGTTKAWSHLWIFWVGPFAGAAAAMIYHHYILRGAAAKAFASSGGGSWVHTASLRAIRPPGRSIRRYSLRARSIPRM